MFQHCNWRVIRLTWQPDTEPCYRLAQVARNAAFCYHYAMMRKPHKHSDPSMATAGGCNFPQPDNRPKRTLVLTMLVAAGLAALTTAAYWRVLEYDFVYLDDPQYVTTNEHVGGGLSGDGVKWAITEVGTNYWHPLTWLSHMLDVSLFGMRAGGHHLTNLVLHTANVLLLFGFLRYSTGRLWASAFVAALFAIHPLHVESVAWISERKDVLSTFFFFAALWLYAYYVKNPAWARYAGVLAVYALGLMAKPMLVTLPFVLVLLDFWPFERFSLERWRVRAAKGSMWELVMEKVPLVLMAVGASIVTVLGQTRSGTLAGVGEIGLDRRLLNAAASYGLYLGKTIWPSGLAVLYPYPMHPPYLGAAISLIILVLITWAAIRSLRSRRYFCVGWLWYLVILLPVVGLIQVGPQSHADRYTYVSLTGIFIIVAWSGGEFVRRRPWLAKPVAIAAAAVLVAAGLFTWRTVGYWKDGMSLATRAVSVTRGNYIMLEHIGRAQVESGDYDTAIRTLSEALEVTPREHATDSLVVLGWLMCKKGRFEEAVRYGNKAIELKPEVSEAWVIVGMALGNLGHLTEAEKYLKRAVDLDPNSAPAHSELGLVMAQAGRPDEAIICYKRAMQLAPEFAEPCSNLGVLYMSKGDYLSAEQVLRESIRLEPERAVNYFRLGAVLAELGRKTDAAAQLKRAIELDPQNNDIQTYYHRLAGTDR